MTTTVFKPYRNGFTGLDRMIDDFFGPQCCSNSQEGFVPRVDVRETEDNIVLMFEVPGINKDDIKVVIDNRVLTVSGKRDAGKQDKDVRYVVSEINYGTFSRSFTLPDTVDTQSVNADYADGMLAVTLARAEQAKPKEIKVS